MRGITIKFTGESEFIVPDSFALINKSNGTNCKHVCKLYDDALVSEHQTNQSSLNIQENQNEIHEPNSNKIDSKLQYNGFGIPIKPIWCSEIVCEITTKLV